MLKVMTTYLKKFVGNEKGQGMVEYGLIIAAVAIIALVGFKFLGGELNTFINNLAGEL